MANRLQGLKKQAIARRGRVRKYLTRLRSEDQAEGLYTLRRRQMTDLVDLLVRGACYYCGSLAAERLNRENPQDGHHPNNVVPICPVCEIFQPYIDHVDFVRFIGPAIHAMRKSWGDKPVTPPGLREFTSEGQAVVMDVLTREAVVAKAVKSQQAALDKAKQLQYSQERNDGQ